ncbi:MAG: nucleotidyltransferase domain-containing protein [Candidatus Hodarchaeaceae archaeon]|nr:nucleotidyltransferase domain-containing protein [Candidatus Hodarchaeaceae archaeon]
MISRLPAEDRKLIARFLDRVKGWAPPTLSGVVLFGSLVRGDFGPRSDIDVLMVFDEPDPRRHLTEVTKIITALKPHREIRPVLTNLKDVGADLLQEVMREGAVLHGKLVVGPDSLALRPYSIISYDLSAADSTTRQRVARRVYGYSSRKRVGKRLREYSYPGLADRKDCFVLGKGVIALPAETAKGFVEFLKRNRVKAVRREAFM